MFDFGLILAAFLFTFFLCSFLVVFSYIISTDQPDSQKLSVFECGFNPFSDARLEFDVKFFLVAILFIIFDLELSFLFPWSVILYRLSFVAYLAMALFFVLLTVGLIYEWVKGGLEWS